jgi:thiosulfate dehydrogenase (quinone) large subunit
MKFTKQQLSFIALRISMGCLFLWAFVDKLFGLGFATESGKAWLDGISPTFGFLTFWTKGPFVDFFQSLAGSVVVDWLFMLGLLGVGVAMIFGLAMRFASYTGALMMFLMWLAVLPPEHNPFMDEHIVYIFVFFLLGQSEAGKWMGLQKKWHDIPLVRRWKWLQ